MEKVNKSICLFIWIFVYCRYSTGSSFDLFEIRAFSRKRKRALLHLQRGRVWTSSLSFTDILCAGGKLLNLCSVRVRFTPHLSPTYSVTKSRKGRTGRVLKAWRVKRNIWRSTAAVMGNSVSGITALHRGQHNRFQRLPNSYKGQFIGFFIFFLSCKSSGF